MRTKMTRVLGGIAMGGGLAVAMLGFGGAVAGAETPAPSARRELCCRCVSAVPSHRATGAPARSEFQGPVALAGCGALRLADRQAKGSSSAPSSKDTYGLSGFTAY